MRVRLCIDEKGTEVVHGRCTTVSEGGFGAILTGDLPEHGHVWVEFRTSKVPQDARFQAEIRQRRGFQYGFQFIAPSPSQKIMIRRIVAEGAEIT